LFGKQAVALRAHALASCCQYRFHAQAFFVWKRASLSESMHLKLPEGAVAPLGQEASLGQQPHRKEGEREKAIDCQTKLLYMLIDPKGQIPFQLLARRATD
jgi:hypothetical protein